MLPLLRSEVFRLRRRWMPWVLVLITMAVALTLYVIIYATTQAQLTALQTGTPVATGGPAATEVELRAQLQSLRPAGVLGFGLGVVSGFGSVMIIVLAASTFGSEFGWGTLRMILALGAGRERLLAVKYIVLALYALLFTALGTLAALVGSEIVATVASLDRALPGEVMARVPAAVFWSSVGYLPYIALAALIAVWSKSSGAAIAIALVVFFAEGIVMSLIVQLNRDLRAIADYGLSRNVSALDQLWAVPSTTPPLPGAVPPPDSAHAIVVLLVYTALFVAVTVWRFRTKDVTGS